MEFYHYYSFISARSLVSLVGPLGRVDVSSSKVAYTDVPDKRQTGGSM
jgi:hypothetical protein